MAAKTQIKPEMSIDESQASTKSENQGIRQVRRL